MYHSGIQTTCNTPLQLSKGKQGSAISGVVERKCIEFTREHPRRDKNKELHHVPLMFMCCCNTRRNQSADYRISIWAVSSPKL